MFAQPSILNITFILFNINLLKFLFITLLKSFIFISITWIVHYKYLKSKIYCNLLWIKVS